MRSNGIILLATACLLVSTDVVMARAVRIWSHQELLDKSDLVVIATLTATNDTQEHIDLPGFAGESVVGVETRFSVSAVLKGDTDVGGVVLHHYRTADGTNVPHVPNGPSFVSFNPPKNPIFNAVREAPPVWRTYILFLLRETDGRYAPVTGQTDPGLGVMELEDVYESAVTETQTKSEIDIGNVLKECQTIKPGMTRAELSKAFTTEGGLSTATHRTYVFRGCPYVKIDVEFTLSDRKDALLERPTDTISNVSKPYLDWSIVD